MGDRKHSTTSCLIVGAGISGMCMAIDLLRRNQCHDFIIVEKGNSFGGTWNDNTYPGCSCDVPSSLYSFSFAQNPGWSDTFATQDEILNYLIGVAEKYDLYRYVRFNTALEGAEWDPTCRKWQCKLKVLGGKELELHEHYGVAADFVVTAVGQLNIPKYPDVPGLKDFKGKIMHSARWDWNYNLEGKKIAMIGNGCTAVQIAPELARKASQLTVFQRTPNWLLPRDNQSISNQWKTLYKYVPGLLSLSRTSIMRYRESLHGAVTDQHSKAAKDLESLSKEFMESQLPNRPDLWKKLTPNYPVGCKRVVKSDDYYCLFMKNNVHLETGKIAKFTSKGIDFDGKHTEFDVIVCATGFETSSFFTEKLHLVGNDGKDLRHIWRKGPRALYGVLAESLPNFGMLYGPNTNLGHNSIILMIEAQCRYLCELVKAVVDARRQGQSLEVKPKSIRMNDFNERMQETLAKSSFSDSACNSWYKNKDGLITTNWSGNVVEYQKLLSKVDWNDFDISGLNTKKSLSKSTYIGRIPEENWIDHSKVLMVAASTFIALAALSRADPAHIFSVLRKS